MKKRMILLTVLLAAVLSGGWVAGKTQGQPATPKSDNPKIVLKLDPKDVKELVDIAKGLQDDEVQYQQAKAFIANYEGRSNARFALRYKLFADNADKGISINKHDLNLDIPAFVEKPPVKKP